MADALLWAYAFAFGAALGSFLNVCIYRLPAEKSVVAPPSACGACGTRIRWYDNIPILSFILLRGRREGSGGNSDGGRRCDHDMSHRLLPP